MSSWISIIVFCLFSCSIQSQIAYGQHLGLKAGFNFSTIGGTADTLEYKYKPGYQVGTLVDIRASGNISIQLEVVYSTQGAWAQRDQDLSVHYNYLNLPIVIRLSTRRKFFFEGGPQFGFLLTAKSKDGSFEVDISEQVNNLDFAILAGVGYELSRRLSANGRFNFGVSSLAKRQQSFELRSTNQVFQLSMAYLFR